MIRAKDPIDWGDTSTMSTKDWENMRMFGCSKSRDVDKCGGVFIGGSSVASFVTDINGQHRVTSPWVTKRELWGRFCKEQMAVEVEFNARAKEHGHILEPYIVEIFQEDMKAAGHSVQILNDQHMYQCGQWQYTDDGDIVTNADGEPELRYPQAIANTDRITFVDGEKSILEIKSTNSKGFENQKNWKNGIVPIYYELQGRWYMAVMNIDSIYFCCAWGFGPDDHAIVKIERDLEIEEYILDQSTEFVNLIKEGKEPSQDDDKPSALASFYSRLYGPVETKGEVEDLSGRPELQEAFDRIKQCERSKASKLAAVAKLEEEIQAQINLITPFCGNKETACFKTESYSAYLHIKNDMTRPKIDGEVIKADAPELLELGNSFDGPTFKKNLKARIKGLNSEAKSYKKAKNSIDEQKCLDEIASLEKLLEKATVPAAYKGTQEKSVKFYDPKIPDKELTFA